MPTPTTNDTSPCMALTEERVAPENVVLSCSTTQARDEKGRLAATVVCPDGSAEYLAQDYGRYHLKLVEGSVVDSPDAHSLEVFGGDFFAASLNERTKRTEVAMVYTNVLSLANAVYRTITCDGMHSVNVTPHVAEQAIIERIQTYAQQHPDVIAQLRPLNLEFAGVLSSLNEALDAPAPQWRACPERTPEIYANPTVVQKVER